MPAEADLETALVAFFAWQTTDTALREARAKAIVGVRVKVEERGCRNDCRGAERPLVPARNQIRPANRRALFGAAAALRPRSPRRTDPHADLRFLDTFWNRPNDDWRARGEARSEASWGGRRLSSAQEFELPQPGEACLEILGSRHFPRGKDGGLMEGSVSSLVFVSPCCRLGPLHRPPRC